MEMMVAETSTETHETEMGGTRGRKGIKSSNNDLKADRNVGGM